MNIDFLIQIAGLQLNLSGFVVGICTYISIWIGHTACIVGEYYFTKRLWIAFLIGGLALVCGALFCCNLIWSTVLSILGFTFLWGIGEIIEQEKRVERGWFPKNPKRERT